MHIDLYLGGVLLLLLHGSLLPGAAAVPVCVPLQQLGTTQADTGSKLCCEAGAAPAES